MSTQHTPGPWVWDPAAETIRGYTAEGEARMVVYESGTNEADGRLMAAAPDLLAALEMVRDADEDCIRYGLPRIPNLPRARIDAAIALATGVTKP